MLKCIYKFLKGYAVDILELREGSLPVLKIDGVKNFDIGKIFDCG